MNIKKHIIIVYFFIFLILIFFIIFIINKSNKEDLDVNKLTNDPTLVVNNDIIIDDNFIPTCKNIHRINTMQEIKKYIYSIDKNAYVSINDLNLSKLASKDLTLDLHSKEPKILIFHTHSQEAFIDSKVGNPDESVVALGSKLAEILVNDYKIPVVHDKGEYDIKDGKLVRNQSYENMDIAIRKILEKYPSIEVTIDLHRDGVDKNTHLVKKINNKNFAKIMFFNGVTKYNNNGEPVDIPGLVNPYVQDNLAFSLQMFLNMNEKYPGLTRKNYIKPYRYSLHLKPRSLLVEVGAQTNTLEEALNSMNILAEVLVDVLQKK